MGSHAPISVECLLSMAFLPGWEYTLRFDVEAANGGGAAAAFLSVHDNQAPAGGTVLAFPQSGTAMNTEFGIVAESWVGPGGRVTRYPISILSSPISILSSPISILLSEAHLPYRYCHLPYRYCHLKVISISILSSRHLVDSMTRSYIVTLDEYRALALAEEKEADASPAAAGGGVRVRYAQPARYERTLLEGGGEKVKRLCIFDFDDTIKVEPRMTRYDLVILSTR